MFFNPIISIVHNVQGQTWHPIVFDESPLPGGVSTLVRHKSKMHHTVGFNTREAAIANAKDDLAVRIKGARFALEQDLFWDGKGVPAMSVFFAEQDGKLLPAF